MMFNSYHDYEVVNAFAAKTHLSQLLAEVEMGKHYMITKHNHPVALLIPLEEESTRSVEQAIDALLKFREKNSLGGLSIKDLIEEGRH